MLLARLATKKAKPDGLFVLGLDRDRDRDWENNNNINGMTSSKNNDKNNKNNNNFNCKINNINNNDTVDIFANITSPNNPSENLKNPICQTEEIQKFLENLPLSQIPGVGFRLERKLAEKKLFNCSDLWSVRKDFLKVRSIFSTMAMVKSLHYTTLNYTTLHYTALHKTAKQYNTIQHNTTQDNKTQNNTPKHNKAQQSTKQYNTTQNIWHLTQGKYF